MGKYTIIQKFPNGGGKCKDAKGNPIPCPPDTKPTTSDSLALYNNTKQLLNYYNQKKYTKDSEMHDIRINKTSVLTDDFELFNKYNTTKRGIRVPTADGKSINKVIPQEIYYKQLDKNRYFKRESANGILDTRAPAALYDDRIDPKSSYMYSNDDPNDSMYGDIVDIYGYDPIAVKPVAMLTPEEKALRIKRYGKDANVGEQPKKPVGSNKPQQTPIDPTIPPSGYNKKYPPIYVTNPKDPRIGRYAEKGNQYLYQAPQERKDYPIRELLPKAQANITIQSPQQDQMPEAEGQIMYGPSNGAIGFMTEQGFVPIKSRNHLSKSNQADIDLLNDNEALQKYVKMNPRFKYGGKNKKKYAFPGSYANGGETTPTFEEWLQQTGQQLLTGNEDTLYQQYQAYVNSLQSDNGMLSGLEHEFNPHGQQEQKTGSYAQITKDPNQLEFSKGFNLFNAGLDITALVAGRVNDMKNRRREKYDYEKARYPQARTSMYENGLNNVPIVYKNGGGPSKEKAAEMLHDGTANKKKLTEKQRKYFAWIAYSKKQNGGESVDDAELEQGEIFQQQDGSINKVNESAPRHEDGGSKQPFVFRVLEDTSDKRKDEASKLLKVEPLEALELVGFKPSKPLTHSALYEKATKYYDTQLAKVQKDTEDAVEYLKLSKDQYGRNTIDENMKNMEAMPTDGMLFDTIFEHQEDVKQRYGIGNDGGKAKYGGNVYATGGEEPIYKTKDGKYYTRQAFKYATGLSDSEINDSLKKGLIQTVKAGTIPVENVITSGETTAKPAQVPPTPTATSEPLYKAKDGVIKTIAGHQADFDITDAEMAQYVKDGKLELVQDANSTSTDGKPAWFKPWIESKTAAGKTSPTGKTTTFNPADPNKFYQQYDKWVALNNGKQFESAAEFQRFILDTVNSKDPEKVKGMWKDWGTTAAGKFDDGIFGARTAALMGEVDNFAPNATPAPQGAQPQQPATPTSFSSNSQIAKPATPSKFHEPLHWYDVAGDIMGLIDNAERTQVPLEQLQRPDLRYREQSPLPTIQQGQEDFNTMVDMLPQNQVGFANQANLYGKKYGLNNQVFGQYENINKSGYNQTDNQNNANRFQLDTANLGLRDQQQQRIMQGQATQQENKLKLFNGLFDTIAQNNALNRNGDLMMQMFPYFDQYGKFNGNQYNVTPNSGVAPKPTSYKRQLNKETGKYDIIPVYNA